MEALSNSLIGILGQEWLSPAVVTYLRRKLVVKSPNGLKYLGKFYFHTVPAINLESDEFLQERLFV